MIGPTDDMVVKEITGAIDAMLARVATRPTCQVIKPKISTFFQSTPRCSVGGIIIFSQPTELEGRIDTVVHEKAREVVQHSRISD